jgi:hypothetical protein
LFELILVTHALLDGSALEWSFDGDAKPKVPKMEPRSPLSSFDSGAVGVSAVEDNRAAAEPAFEVLVALLVLLLLLLLLELEVVPTAYCADVVLALDGAAATAELHAWSLW